MNAELQSIHLLLHTHDQTLKKHTRILRCHTQRLEKKVDQTESNTPCLPPGLPHLKPSPHTAIQSCGVIKRDRLDIESLSDRERKIVNVFFEHPEMSLSYADIAVFLNKSPNTIKNQLRQLGMKVDLFTKHVDSESRNRFRLKNNLRLEKYLNVADRSFDQVDHGRPN